MGGGRSGGETFSLITQSEIYDILCKGGPKSSTGKLPKSSLYNGLLGRYVRMNFFDLREAFAPAARPKDDHIARLDLYVERNPRGEIIYVRVG